MCREKCIELSLIHIELNLKLANHKKDFLYNHFIHTVFRLYVLQAVLIESIERFCSLTEWVRNVFVFSTGSKSKGTFIVLRVPDLQSFRYISEVRPHVLTLFIH